MERSFICLPFAHRNILTLVFLCLQILIINGAQSGVAGYANVKAETGQSNAANPTYKPLLYDPLAAPGNVSLRQHSRRIGTANLLSRVAALLVELP